MANPRRLSWDIPLDTPARVIEVTVRYSTANPDEQQGYWLTVAPVTIDGCWRTTTAYTGFKRPLAPSSRFSAPALARHAESVRADLADPSSTLALSVHRLKEALS